MPASLQTEYTVPLQSYMSIVNGQQRTTEVHICEFFNLIFK
jgi:hypothetical protein